MLDSSAILAALLREAGADRVGQLRGNALVSTVNLAEVQTKLVHKGMPDEVAWWHIEELGFPSIQFEAQQARVAGSLVKITRPYGLSLGDRACLALAIERKAKVYTADRAWANLSLGVEIEVIR